MLRIAVCDDTAACADYVEETVKSWAEKRCLNVQTEKMRSGEEMLEAIEQTGYYDIIFMDIDLKSRMNGLETAEKIREKDWHTCLIFISQYDNYLREVFRVQPFYYLQKPVPGKQIFKILDTAVERYRYLNEIYVFRYKGKTYSISLKDVLYFTSDKRIIRVKMTDGREYVFYETLDKLEFQLVRYMTRFLRIHKSYLVNGLQVEEYHPQQVMMRNRELLPISLDKRKTVGRFHMELLVRDN